MARNTNLILHIQELGMPCSFALISFCGQRHMLVPEASNSVANCSVCCFGSECLVRNRIALCVQISEHGIAVSAVLRREECQTVGSNSFGLIVVFPVPPAPMSRHALCFRSFTGTCFISSSTATSRACPNHWQMARCPSANSKPFRFASGSSAEASNS